MKEIGGERVCLPRCWSTSKAVFDGRVVACLRLCGGRQQWFVSEARAAIAAAAAAVCTRMVWLINMCFSLFPYLFRGVERTAMVVCCAT